MPYSKAFKNRMIQKMTGTGAMSATALSKECGVSQATLSSWLRKAGSVGADKRDMSTNGMSMVTLIDVTAFTENDGAGRLCG
jgi:transposase-like protein